MIKLMSAELMATIIGTAATIITLAVTIYLTNRSTQKILRGHEEILERIAHTIHSIAHLTEKVASHSEVGFELQGIKTAGNAKSEGEAKKLGKLIKYNPKFRLAYYRPQGGA